ncbi:MAG: DUF4199 domain-containing protein [Bacteroidota bacterium]
MNHAIKWGLIGGIGIVLIDALLYIVDPYSLFGWWPMLEWLVYIPVMIKAGMDERDANGGFMTWGEALKPTFLTFVVSSLLYTIFYYLLFNVIDPGLEDMQMEAMMEMADKMEAWIGEEGAEAMKEGIEEQDLSFTFSRACLTYATRLLFPGFIFAAITALVVRRNPPDDLPMDEM